MFFVFFGAIIIVKRYFKLIKCSYKTCSFFYISYGTIVNVYDRDVLIGIKDKILSSSIWFSGSVIISCPERLYQCSNRQCVVHGARCNGRTECSDGSDESSCVEDTTESDTTSTSIGINMSSFSSLSLFSFIIFIAYRDCSHFITNRNNGLFITHSDNTIGITHSDDTIVTINRKKHDRQYQIKQHRH